MSRWWRAYDDSVDHSKLLLLSDRGHRAWFNLCCLASANGGTLPEMKVMALKLRMSPAKVMVAISELKQAGLIDEEETGMRPHNWDARQFKSDVSTERVKRFRKRSGNVSSTVSVTPPETETETDRKKESKIAADAAPTNGEGRYAFETGIIRLTSKDFSKWEKAFKHLDLAAELTGLAQWAGAQGPENWFFAVSGALAKRNRELKCRADAIRAGGPPRPLTPSGNPWPDGIV